jgi:hypothetical protein
MSGGMYCEGGQMSGCIVRESEPEVRREGIRREQEGERARERRVQGGYRNG